MVAKLGFFTGILKPIYNPFNGKKQLLIITINSQPRTLHLARDVMQLHVYLVPHGRHHPAGIQPLLPDSDYTCSHDVTLRIAKTNLAIRGVLHASTCALPVRNLRRAFCEQNTPRRPLFSREPRVGEPKVPSSSGFKWLRNLGLY